MSIDSSSAAGPALCLVRQYNVACNGGGLEGMLAFLTVDAAHDIDQGAGEIGREALRDWIRQARG